MNKNIWKIKIKDFWQNNEYKIVLFIGFILVAVISFEAGILKGAEVRQDPIIIEKPVENVISNEVNNKSVNSTQTVQGASQSQNLTPEAQKDAIKLITPDQAVSANRQDCIFVGSKNSNKYHLPTCRYAKNIKPENLVCFSSQDEAKSRGYLPDKNCIK